MTDIMDSNTLLVLVLIRKDMKNAEEKTDEQIRSWLSEEIDKMIKEEEKLVSE